MPAQVDCNLADDEVESHGWFSVTTKDVSVAPPARLYKGGYSVDGGSCANLAEGLLKSFVPSTFGGLLYIFCAMPPESGPLDVLYFLTGSSDPGYSARAAYRFKDEYPALLAVLAWCLVCDWEFVFCMDEGRAIIAHHSEHRLSIAWLPRDDDADLLEIMQALDYKAS
jgi:hypothetical protein